SQMSAVMSFAEFLATTPPGCEEVVTKLVCDLVNPGPVSSRRVCSPEVIIECPVCDGLRGFSCFDKNDGLLRPDASNFAYLTYTCRNCGQYQKTVAFHFKTPPQGTTH